jgi:two-component system alkaline phosphatase synthesis response regulator PhoP
VSLRRKEKHFVVACGKVGLLPNRNVVVARNVGECRIRQSVRKKILIVDDDVDILNLLSFNLKKAGFAVGTASDGIEAIKKVRSLEPDLVLLDLLLPELDGFAVCEILRRDKTTATIPIIIVTALSSELSRLAGMDCGADAYVTKPFSPRQLVSKVDDVLKKLDRSHTN